MSGPRRALVLAYDGTDFLGWQVQPTGRTVQGVVEAALGEVLGAPVRVQGSGRTDAGVHARAQVAHFDDPAGLPLERLHGALAAALPDDVRPVALLPVADDFHALHDARRKTYVYRLHLSRSRGGQRTVERSLPPLRRRDHLAVREGLDLAAMRAAAARLVGTHDFTTFSKAMPEGRGTVKTLEALRVLRGPRSLALLATGDGFLYGMVRLLAGLLVEVGRGRVAVDAVPALLEARDRAAAPASLPARGLCLGWVDHGARLPRSKVREGLVS